MKNFCKNVEILNNKIDIDDFICRRSIMVSSNLKKVLVIEDDTKNMKLFIAILKRIPDIQIVSEEKGDQAVDLIKNENPDLVILDIQLPGKSGIEICKELRTLEAFKTVPLVAVTAFAMKGDKERILDAGFTSYVSKPINVQKFKELINNFLLK